MAKMVPHYTLSSSLV